MTVHRKPLGKLGPTYKIELQLPSVDEKIKREQYEARKVARKESRDRSIEWLGRSLRSVLALDDEKPVSRKTAHRAGLTAIGIGMSVTAALGGLTAYGLTDEDDTVCKTFLMSDFGETAGIAATAVSQLYYDLEDNNVYDNALKNFITTGKTQVCEPYLDRVPEGN